MRGAQTLGDALRSAGLRGHASDKLDEVETPRSFHSEIAADLMARRAESLGLSGEMVGKAILRGLRSVRDAAEFCETPIEKQILPYLIFGDYGDDVLTIPAGWHSNKVHRELGGEDVVVIPQFEFARFRMDFCLVSNVKGRRSMVCVECDGRHTHDPVSDDYRDRYLASFGIPTVRITGKDCYATPQGSAARAISALRELMEG